MLFSPLREAAAAAATLFFADAAMSLFRHDVAAISSCRHVYDTPLLFSDSTLLIRCCCLFARCRHAAIGTLQAMMLLRRYWLRHFRRHVAALIFCRRCCYFDTLPTPLPVDAAGRHEPCAITVDYDMIISLPDAMLLMPACRYATTPRCC